MGIDLMDTYGKDIINGIGTMDYADWSKYRDSMLDDIFKMCPHFIIYDEFMSPSSYFQKKPDSMKWCVENLRGRFCGSLIIQTENGKEERVVRFEFEEDAMAFKLRWL